MDPLALSYRLTNINIDVQYGSNLIMSYNVWLFFLEESWWTFCCIQGYQSISEDLGTCTIKDQFFQCEKGTFFDGGGKGLLWSEWANLAFKLYFKTSLQNRHRSMCNKGKITTYFWKKCAFLRLFGWLFNMYSVPILLPSKPLNYIGLP